MTTLELQLLVAAFEVHSEAIAALNRRSEHQRRKTIYLEARITALETQLNTQQPSPLVQLGQPPCSATHS